MVKLIVQAGPPLSIYGWLYTAYMYGYVQVRPKDFLTISLCKRSSKRSLWRKQTGSPFCTTASVTLNRRPSHSLHPHDLPVSQPPDFPEEEDLSFAGFILQRILQHEMVLGLSSFAISGSTESPRQTQPSPGPVLLKHVAGKSTAHLRSL